MGGTGDPPVLVGDPPTGIIWHPQRETPPTRESWPFPIPSGGSPDGTGRWPVPPKTEFENTPEKVLHPDHAQRADISIRRTDRFRVASSPTGKFCPPTTNFSFQLSEEVVQNCSSRRKEALISSGFEPRYLGCYEVLELARNFSFYFPLPGVASPHINNQYNGL
jgi:hypothetical protein